MYWFDFVAKGASKGWESSLILCCKGCQSSPKRDSDLLIWFCCKGCGCQSSLILCCKGCQSSLRVPKFTNFMLLTIWIILCCWQWPIYLILLQRVSKFTNFMLPTIWLILLQRVHFVFYWFHYFKSYAWINLTGVWLF